MNKPSPIVIVYLNDFLPRYAIKNIRYMENTFKNREIIVLISDKKFISKNSELSRAKYIVPSGLDSEISHLRRLTSHPSNFRNDFWNVTIARFSALQKFMEEYDHDSLFHFEADVLVAPYFPFKEIENLQKKIAFPKVSNVSAAGSVFYVNGADVLNKMNLFFRQCLEKNPSLTDMNLLSRFSREYEDIHVSLFAGVESAGAESEVLFDAACFGIYLTGGDPRNSRGWIEYYRDVADHLSKPSGYEFSLTSEKEIIARKNNTSFVIQNLHIHSKNPKYFGTDWPGKKLASQIKNSNEGPKRKFSLTVYCYLAHGFFLRRSKKIFSKLFWFTQ